MKYISVLAFALLLSSQAFAKNIFVEGRVRDDESCPSLMAVDGVTEDGSSFLKCAVLAKNVKVGPKARIIVSDHFDLISVQELGTIYINGTVKNKIFNITEFELMGE